MAELWEVLKQLGLTAAGRQGAQNITNRESGPPHAGLPKPDGWVDGDAIKQIHDSTLRPLPDLRAPGLMDS